MTRQQWNHEMLDQFATAVTQAISAGNERVDRLEQAIEADRAASNQRMTQFDQRLDRFALESHQRLTRIEQSVESNNRFLEAFSQDLRRYTDNMDRLTQQLSAVTAGSNQDRMEVNTRLSAIQRRVEASPNI